MLCSPLSQVGCPSSPRGPRTCTGWRRFTGAPATPSPSPSPATPTMASRTQHSRSPGRPVQQPCREAATLDTHPFPLAQPISTEQGALRIILNFDLLTFDHFSTVSKWREPVSPHKHQRWLCYADVGPRSWQGQHALLFSGRDPVPGVESLFISRQRVITRPLETDLSVDEAEWGQQPPLGEPESALWHLGEGSGGRRLWEQQLEG